MAAAGTLEIQLIADVARLQKDMREMQNAVNAATGGMETSFNKVGRAAKAANDNIGKSAQLSRHHVMNLGYQFQDLAVSLASGQKPMTVFLQQGSQIGSVMAEAGVGIGAVIKQFAKMTAGLAAAALANPVFLGIAAAVGVAYVAFQDFNNEVKKSGELDKYVASLGLTKEEMKKLGPVGITAMDVVKGLWMTISDGLNLGPVFSGIGKFFGDLFRGIASTASDLMAGLYGLFVGGYRGIVAVWDQLPAAFGDLSISAANYMIRGLENMVNAAIQLLNGLIGKANGLLSAVGMSTISPLTKIDIPELQNRYAGAGKKAAAAFGGEIVKATAQARGAFTAFGTQWGDNSVKAAMERIGDKAGDLIDKRAEKKLKEKAKKTGKDFGEELTKSITKTLGDMNMDTLDFASKFRDQFAKAANDDMKFMDDGLNRAIDLRLDAVRDQMDASLKTATDGAKIIADTIGGSLGRNVDQLSNVMSRKFPEFSQRMGKAFDGIKSSLDGILGSFGTSLKTVAGGFAVGGAVGGVVGGSATGGAVGGAFGSALGETFKSLGKFGGPLGAIAGGILGSVVGGLFKKTKSASATIALEAGKLDVAGVVGNNADFKKTANTLAGAVISGLSNAAEALGAQITNSLRISIGQRKDKFILDLSGAGRTKGIGTLSFDSEGEAISFAIDKAIRDGILGGLRESTNRLLQGFGDVEARIKKATDYEAVFTAVRQAADPLGYAMEGLEKKLTSLKALFEEAGASAEEYAILEQYAQQERNKIIAENTKQAEQEQAAADLLRQKRELEITLMEAQGDTAGALALRRQMELAAMDASLQGIQNLIYAQQDLNAARDKEQNAISDLRAAMSTLDGNVAAAEQKLANAIKAQRQREIEGLRGQMAQLDGVIAQRGNAQQALRKAYDAEVARIDDEIAKRQANIQSLESAYNDQASIIQRTIDGFRALASNLRDFAATVVPLNSNGASSISQLKQRFADAISFALAGGEGGADQVSSTGNALRDAVINNATDRVSMLRDLYAIQRQAEEAAIQADAQGTIAEQQLVTLRAQYDAMIASEEAAIVRYQEQKAALTAQVEQFITLNEKTLSVDEAIRQLQTAEAAALDAERQKEQLQQQIDWLTALDTEIISVEEAQRELAAAQAERDALLYDVVRHGFEGLINATNKSALEAGRLAIQQISEARRVIEPNALLPNMVSSLGRDATSQQIETALETAKTAAEATKLNPGTVYFNIDAATAARLGNPALIGTVMSIQELQRAMANVPQFADGGMHSGGLRIVGENGPELEATGASRIYSADQVANMMGGGATAEEVKALRSELKVAMYQIAKNTGKSYDLMNRWDGDGLPPERIAA